MTISFTIPSWILWTLATYYVVGLLQWPFLVMWTARFISPRLTGWQRFKGFSAKQLVLGLLIGSGLLWPLMVGDTLKDEWRYGLGKKWRNR